MAVLVLLVIAVAGWRAWRRSAAAAPPMVTIQDGKTIDFSSGKPVVKSERKEKEAIDRAVRAMDAAAASVTFAPTVSTASTTAAGKK